jgi:hypothetical protein
VLEHKIPVGTELGPWLQGFVARYETKHNPPTEGLRGRLCVVKLRSGETTLIAELMNFENVEWAAPVTWLSRR